MNVFFKAGIEQACVHAWEGLPFLGAQAQECCMAWFRTCQQRRYLSTS